MRVEKSIRFCRALEKYSASLDATHRSFAESFISLRYLRHPGYTLVMHSLFPNMGHLMRAVAGNKPLKDRLRAKWISELRLRIKKNDKVAPRRYGVMEWLVEAWSALLSQTIVNGFRNCRLLPRSMDSSSTVDNVDDIADVVVDDGLLDAHVARRVIEPGRLRDEDDIKWMSDSEEFQESQGTFCI
nr:AlNc14C55G4228 [Albugo laibachii Nc14]CCA25207.1 AlNc14C281G10118 [Albugo laibachii Nc14]|eukprot:CCA25207.1 AlNc14C281G10118 [Albugo laibachii Nc14]